MGGREGGWITPSGLGQAGVLDQPLSAADGAPAQGCLLPWLEVHWWGGVAETCPLYGWRGAVNGAGRKEDVRGETRERPVGRAPGLQAELGDVGLFAHGGQYWGWGQV